MASRGGKSGVKVVDVKGRHVGGGDESGLQRASSLLVEECNDISCAKRVFVVNHHHTATSTTTRNLT